MLSSSPKMLSYQRLARSHNLTKNRHPVGEKGKTQLQRLDSKLMNRRNTAVILNVFRHHQTHTHNHAIGMHMCVTHTLLPRSVLHNSLASLPQGATVSPISVEFFNSKNVCLKALFCFHHSIRIR